MVFAHRVLTSPCSSVLQADHLFGQKRLRWEIDAGGTTCHAHHIVITHSQSAHALFGMKMLGAGYAEMLVRANDDRGKHTYLRAELEEKYASLQFMAP